MPVIDSDGRIEPRALRTAARGSCGSRRASACRRASMSISTAAISSSASVAAWKPPVSTSTTTGRKPRKRRAMSAGAGGRWRRGCRAGCGSLTAGSLMRLALQAPADALAGAQRHQLARRRTGSARGTSQGSFSSVRRAGVARQAVEIRAVDSEAKASQPLERPGGSKASAYSSMRGVRGEDPGAAAGALLGAARVRRAVGAEEEARIAACHRVEQRRAVGLAP